jgi:hypothetical protein
MQKETVIATVRAEIDLSQELRAFLSQFKDRENAWFARDDGEMLLAEFGHEWNNNFVEIVQAVVSSHFRDLGLSDERMPEVKLTDSRRGSWLMEAAIIMYGTIGTTYTILKGLSELPKLADGLEDTKKRLQKELTDRFKKKVPERIEPVLQNATPAVQLPSPVVAHPVTVNCSVDARPLRGLTPDLAKSHAIHLSVAVSRSALSVENLGESAIENLRIGLFKSPTQRHSWDFADAYSKSLPRLSGKQSTSLSIDQFLAQTGISKLDLTDPVPLYVDCWLQDNSGIYIFNFYLE